MSKTFAKLVDSKLEILTHVPHVSDPTEKHFEEYAAVAGYKLLVKADKPGKYYDLSYKETAKRISEVWTAWNLDAARKDALDIAQYKLDDELSRRTTVKCEGFENGIIYDQNALTNAIGLEVDDTFIDAEDGLHRLTEEDIVNIKAALKGYRLGLYVKVTGVRQNINQAQSVDEIESAINSLAIL